MERLYQVLLGIALLRNVKEPAHAIEGWELATGKSPEPAGWKACATGFAASGVYAKCGPVYFTTPS